MNSYSNLPSDIDSLKQQIAALEQEKAVLLQQEEKYKHALAQQEARRQKAEAILRQQREISLMLGSTSDLSEVLHELLETIFQMGGLDCGGVYLIDEHTGDLILMVHAGLPDEFVAQTGYFETDSPQAVLVKQGRPIYSQYAAAAPVMDDVRQKAGLRALAIIPVKFEGEVVAVFNLASHTLDVINPESHKVLEALIAPMGGVIARVRERTANFEKANAQLKQEVLIRKQAETALKESQARLSVFFNQSLDGCFFMMLDKPIRWDDSADKEALLDYAFDHQRITEVNDVMLGQYNAERSEFIGLTPRDFFAHDLVYGRQLWRDFWDNGRTHLETHVRKADGTSMWIEGEFVCLYDDDGRITGHFGIQRDITGRKQAAAEMEDSRKMLRLILDNIPQAVFWKDRQSVFLGCNQAFANDANFADPEALIGLTDFDMPWADDQADFYRMIDQQVMENDQPQYNIEESQTQADGKQIWLLTNKVPLHDTTGNVVGVLGTYEDITELKRAEEALRNSEELYRRIVDTAEEGIWLLDAAGHTQFVNDKMAEMLQYEPDEMIGRHLFAFVDEAGQSTAAENLQRRQQGIREQHDFKFQRRDGADIWTIVATSPIWDDDGRYLGALGMVTDITDRQRVQKELESYTRRLEMLRHVEHGILEIRSPEAIAGELLNRLRGFLPFVRGSIVLIDWQTEMVEILASMSLVDTQLKAGMRRPLIEFGFREEILSGELFNMPGLNEMENPPPVVQQLMKEGVACIIGVPLMSQGVVMGVFFLGGGKPHSFTDEQLEIARELAHSLAVAIQQARLVEQIQQQTRELERRVADRTRDLQAANKRLKQLDRLKSKFVSDITHELRTPVTNMLLYLDLMRFGKPENHGHYQQVLQEQAERLRQLVEDSLDLSRLDLAQEDVKFLPLDLNDIVVQAVSVYAKKAEAKGLAFHFVSGAPMPKVPVDGGQISRMIGNLLENAIGFTPAGQVQIVTLLDDKAEFAGIRVQDTGIGFTEEDRKHCFLPFYRGERVGQLNVPGNGLGLALVKRIVDLHNGRITVESVVDAGSTVTVWLPLGNSA